MAIYDKDESGPLPKPICFQAFIEAALIFSTLLGMLDFVEFCDMIFGNLDFEMQCPEGVRQKICRRAKEVHSDEDSVFFKRARQWKKNRDDLQAGYMLRTKLGSLFDEEDTDKSGSLSVSELLQLLKKYFKSEGISKSSKKMERCVRDMMHMYDRDGSGFLEFEEFGMLFCDTEELTGVPSVLALPPVLPRTDRLYSSTNKH